MAHYREEDMKKLNYVFATSSTRENIVSIAVIVSFAALLIFAFVSNYFAQSFFAILVISVPLTVFAIITINKHINKLFSETEQGLNFTMKFGKTDESEMWTSVSLFCSLFVTASVFAFACLILKFSNGYVVTANAFVEPDNHRKDFISFDDTRLIKSCGNRHEFRTQPNTRKGDCVVVEYRQNPIVYHFREVKNLGAMSKQECFAQSPFRQPEKIM